MNPLELLLIAVGLSMDAFAIAVCAGLCMKEATLKDSLTVGSFFGGFQALMPIIGYFVGERFAGRIGDYDHWIVFAVLLFIGAKMIWGSFDRKYTFVPSTSFRDMMPLSIATSIDALAVGMSFALLDVEIYPAALLIGVVTLLLSMSGVKIGHMFGKKYKSKAELAGGAILILIGLKIVLEHAGAIS